MDAGLGVGTVCHLCRLQSVAQASSVGNAAAVVCVCVCKNTTLRSGSLNRGKWQISSSVHARKGAAHVTHPSPRDGHTVHHAHGGTMYIVGKSESLAVNPVRVRLLEIKA